MPIPQWEDSFTDPTDEFAGLFMQPTQEMIPDDFQQQFSSSDPKLTFGTYGPGVLAKPIIGFGPGDYSGGYTGEGDSIYWGAFGGAADPPPSSVSATTLLPPSQASRLRLRSRCNR